MSHPEIQTTRLARTYSIFLTPGYCTLYMCLWRNSYLTLLLKQNPEFAHHRHERASPSGSCTCDFWKIGGNIFLLFATGQMFGFHLRSLWFWPDRSHLCFLQICLSWSCNRQHICICSNCWIVVWSHSLTSRMFHRRGREVGLTSSILVSSRPTCRSSLRSIRSCPTDSLVWWYSLHSRLRRRHAGRISSRMRDRWPNQLSLCGLFRQNEYLHTSCNVFCLRQWFYPRHLRLPKKSH